MAATGLLGINPYQKGINLDITSRPANLAIQLEQKEAAKREALDKYLMDYEKSLDPSGMRKQDQDVFLGKLAQAKQYYLQNRDYIRVYQYLYYRNKKYEKERDLDKVNLIQNNFKISLEE